MTKFKLHTRTFYCKQRGYVKQLFINALVLNTKLTEGNTCFSFLESEAIKYQMYSIWELVFLLLYSIVRRVFRWIAKLPIVTIFGTKSGILPIISRVLGIVLKDGSRLQQRLTTILIFCSSYKLSIA